MPTLERFTYPGRRNCGKGRLWRVTVVVAVPADSGVLVLCVLVLAGRNPGKGREPGCTGGGVACLRACLSRLSGAGLVMSPRAPGAVASLIELSAVPGLDKMAGGTATPNTGVAIAMTFDQRG